MGRILRTLVSVAVCQGNAASDRPDSMAATILRAHWFSVISNGAGMPSSADFSVATNPG